MVASPLPSRGPKRGRKCYMCTLFERPLKEILNENANLCRFRRNLRKFGIFAQKSSDFRTNANAHEDLFFFANLG